MIYHQQKFDYRLLLPWKFKVIERIAGKNSVDGHVAFWDLALVWAENSDKLFNCNHGSRHPDCRGSMLAILVRDQTSPEIVPRCHDSLQFRQAQKAPLILPMQTTRLWALYHLSQLVVYANFRRYDQWMNQSQVAEAKITSTAACNAIALASVWLNTLRIVIRI